MKANVFVMPALAAVLQPSAGPQAIGRLCSQLLVSSSVV